MVRSLGGICARHGDIILLPSGICFPLCAVGFQRHNKIFSQTGGKSCRLEYRGVKRLIIVTMLSSLARRSAVSLGAASRQWAASNSAHMMVGPLSWRSFSSAADTVATFDLTGSFEVNWSLVLLCSQFFLLTALWLSTFHPIICNELLSFQRFTIWKSGHKTQ